MPLAAITNGSMTNGLNTTRINSTIKSENMYGDGTNDINIAEKKKYTEEEIISSIEKANKSFIAYDRRFEFSIHEKTRDIMVKVIDVVTDEVIREIPPEKILDMVSAIWEVVGIMVDERV
jgi:flagellar protein FlaG